MYLEMHNAAITAWALMEMYRDGRATLTLRTRARQADSWKSLGSFELSVDGAKRAHRGLERAAVENGLTLHIYS